MTCFRAIELFVALCLLTASMAAAQQAPPVPGPYFPLYGNVVLTDTVIPLQVGGTVEDVGIVGYSNYDQAQNLFVNETPTNLTWSDNATWQNNLMFAYKSSVINVAGNSAKVTGGTLPAGRINGKLQLNDESTLNLSAEGTVHEVLAFDNTTVNLNGDKAFIGDVVNGVPQASGGILVDGNATFNMNGGGPLSA